MTTSGADNQEFMPVDAPMYQQLGVSARKDAVHSAVSKLSAPLYPGAFCRIVPSLDGNPDHCTVMHSDGVGTKASLAYVFWRETGDDTVFRLLAQDALAMNLNDIACVGAFGPIALTTTINRNPRYVTDNVVARIIEGVEVPIEHLKHQGVTVYNSGGETADTGDLTRTIQLDASVCASMPRADVIDNSRIQPGDVIIGLKAEIHGGSGIGCNGLTLARHALLGRDIAEKYPESYDPALGELAYRNSRIFINKVPQFDALCSPTPIYLPSIKQLAQALPGRIHGIVHCTGGGQTKILRTAPAGLHIVKDNLFELPNVFFEIALYTDFDWRQMYSVYNMGHLMEVYVRSEDASAAIDALQGFGVEPRIVGHVEQDEPCTAQLTISTSRGTFKYRL